VSEWLFCFRLQNVTEIGQSAAELWQQRFLKWRPSAILILKMFIFGHATVTEFQICICYQISSKSDDFLLRYADFTIFKMADLRHLEF